MRCVMILGVIIATLGMREANAYQLDSLQQAAEVDKEGSTTPREREEFTSWKHEPKGPAGLRMMISCVDVSSDGRTVLAACMDPKGRSSFSVGRVIDAKTGKGLRDLYGHKRGLSSIAISPDNTFAVTGGHDQTMRSWEIETGFEIRKFERKRFPVLGVAISPDGKQALSCYEGPHLWDLKTGKLLHTFQGHTTSVWAVAFSPDGKQILSGAWDGTVRLWDLTTREEIRRFGSDNGQTKRVRFSPNGELVASCATSNSKVRLWVAKSGASVREIEAHANGVASVEFSPDGRQLLTSGGGQGRTGRWIKRPAVIRLWDVATGKQILQLDGHDSYVSSAIFSPQGRWVISGGGDGVIRTWDLKNRAKQSGNTN